MSEKKPGLASGLAPWIVMVIVMGCFMLTYDHFRPQPATNPCSSAFMEGWKKGAIAVINYDTQAEGLPPYASWEEFEAKAEASRARMTGLQAFFDELDKDRTAREIIRKAHPPLKLGDIK